MKPAVTMTIDERKLLEATRCNVKQQRDLPQGVSNSASRNGRKVLPSLARRVVASIQHQQSEPGRCRCRASGHRTCLVNHGTGGPLSIEVGLSRTPQVSHRAVHTQRVAAAVSRHRIQAVRYASTQFLCQTHSSHVLL